MAGRPSSTDRTTHDAENRIGWRMAGLGMEVAAQAAGGALLGWLYDSWRGRGHTGVLVGAMIGIVVGLWTLINGGLKLNRQLDELAAKRKAERHQNRDSGTSVLSPGPGTYQTESKAEDDDWDDWNDDDWGNGNDSNDEQC